MREDGATDPPRDWLEKCQWTQNMLAAHADKERERERDCLVSAILGRGLFDDKVHRSGKIRASNSTI